MQPTLLFILLAAFAGSLSALTTTEEAAVRRICAEVITQPGENMIAGLVRLIFHDCVGGCNGCINLELVDNGGDFANRGLARYIDRLDARFEDARNAGIESRADYWALCAAEALRHGRAKVNNAAPLIVPMRYGRADCNSDSPSTSDTSHAHLFPNAKLGFNHVVGWCATTFGMTQTECVALLGAHTLGRAEGRFSGYQGPWVQNEDALDNQYYIDLRDQLWSQVNVAASGQTPRWQYATGGGGIGQLMMLNIDMCLLKDIQVEPDGEGPQTLDGVSNSPTAAVVERYANNDYLWIRDFEQVFIKMIENNTPALKPATGPSVHPGGGPGAIIGGGRRDGRIREGIGGDRRGERGRGQEGGSRGSRNRPGEFNPREGGARGSVPREVRGGNQRGRGNSRQRSSGGRGRGF